MPFTIISINKQNSFYLERRTTTVSLLSKRFIFFQTEGVLKEVFDEVSVDKDEDVRKIMSRPPTAAVGNSTGTSPDGDEGY